MWIVKLALTKPYTFVVAAILILLLGIASVATMPTDILPNIDIPVITVVYDYRGLQAQEMEQRITTFNEFIMSTVNDVKSIDSQTVRGYAVLMIYFQPQVHIDAAIAQVGAATQSIRFRFPPGVNPPWVLRFSASTVPIYQLALSSDSLSQSELYDYGIFRVRQKISVVPGTLLEAPHGGVVRQIMVDLNQQALLAKGLTPIDVESAITSQDVTMPTGTIKIGGREYGSSLNNSPIDALALNDVPVKVVGNSVIFMRDVAHVRDGWMVQQNVVRANGKPSVLTPIYRSGSVSTLSIIDHIKNKILPAVQAAAPKGMTIKGLFDQSVIVRASITGVVREAIIASMLTALMILVFLGSWRSTLIIAVSIPLSILSSIIILNALGQTLNTMTLGGLALAVGILVDDATVTIENIHRHMDRHSLFDAVLKGASEIAAPTFVSTLTICIVFVSVVFLTGPAKYLFTPMAMAVVFAMMASYILSRTLVPTLVNFLLAGETHYSEKASDHTAEEPRPSWFEKFNDGFNAAYLRFQAFYTGLLHGFIEHQRTALIACACVMATAFVLLPFVGQDFFPSVDTGQFRLHMRAMPGTRIEESSVMFSQVEQKIREIIPPDQLDLVLDDIGLPQDPISFTFGFTPNIGAFDGEVLVSLNEKHSATEGYIEQLRKVLPKDFPSITFYFEPADMVTRILDFGVTAPIDVQVQGTSEGNFDVARDLRTKIAAVPGAVDVHTQQVMDSPTLKIDVDRTRAAQFGLTQQDVANSLFVSMASGYAVAPNFWADPKMGITYTVTAQTPQYRLDSMNMLKETPIPIKTVPNQTEMLGNMATISPSYEPIVVNHHNVQRVYDVLLNTQATDLGSIAKRVQKIVDEEQKKLPPGNTIEVRGQVESMHEAFTRLGIGLVFAAVLVYLLMVVNYQSWLDPFIIICALPGAFCGIVWALFLTQTTFSVPSLMGAIMSIGVATANSILLVTFAKQQSESGHTALEAAVSAGSTRLRPILMTAFAMIVGMLPMALGLGEGGEQNAPLARAVIGGLSMATFATLFFVPLMYSLIHGRREATAEEIAQ
ncbi:efflux RND transporter permease subunit [Acidicapsa acidisoli]|uniref:efflux RND transporter permease subunit n=1 Tax=Acidicapsa acidisoli TaxID=1615681 RepID=UPI0021DFC456|nr:efflux RND transporter permease subunit [Acidicapsa acidisoli]